jgi:hypothetical protein
VLRPVEVEVDKLLTLLLVVLRPVERLEMPLVAVLRPVDVEVDKTADAARGGAQARGGRSRQASQVAVGRAQAGGKAS